MFGSKMTFPGAQTQPTLQTAPRDNAKRVTFQETDTISSANNTTSAAPNYRIEISKEDAHLWRKARIYSQDDEEQPLNMSTLPEGEDDEEVDILVEPGPFPNTPGEIEGVLVRWWVSLTPLCFGFLCD
jgi:hypothetical protein